MTTIQRAHLPIEKGRHTHARTHKYYTWNHTRFFPHSRTNGIWNILCQLDVPNNGSNTNNNGKEKNREENKQSNKTCTYIHNYYFCKIISTKHFSWMSEYLHVLRIAWNTTKLLVYFVLYCWKWRFTSAIYSAFKSIFFRCCHLFFLRIKHAHFLYS